MAHLAPGTVLGGLPCPGVTLGGKTMTKSLLGRGFQNSLGLQPHYPAFNPILQPSPCPLAKWDQQNHLQSLNI